jgi:hypothetical protein
MDNYPMSLAMFWSKQVYSIAMKRTINRLIAPFFAATLTMESCSQPLWEGPWNGESTAIEAEVSKDGFKGSDFNPSNNRSRAKISFGRFVAGNCFLEGVTASPVFTYKHVSSVKDYEIPTVRVVVSGKSSDYYKAYTVVQGLDELRTLPHFDQCFEPKTSGAELVNPITLTGDI